ncbi:ribonucleoside-diphosphate reductase alpha chain [Mycoplasma testudineum]|uniref:Ribonucleoside-diphosphate reductase n=1 Tax=Mycoplasma testudineum TaxID=244584 RepID=A0A4R6ICV3_9MOLU|nr:class 1b ribonucleoside-diphosphate reductase subunit alpha [Mycoplasma testudineum]OYD26608.1 ribonucleotide-diphosphate reductase subunit alpha [Mycoplasma testudineum]TDO19441.1 ribonucleoside-diphosphate reductase alpha chain [Mycoplasma testudineum]
MSKILNDEYIYLNALTKLTPLKDIPEYSYEQQAIDKYFELEINPKTKVFKDEMDRLKYLVDNDYYEAELIKKYSDKFLIELFERAKSYNHKFPTFMGVLKFYNAYALKSFDGKQYLENFTQRVIMNALFLANGNEEQARKTLDIIISGKFQPATPTFLNAGKKQRGEFVSCYLIRTEDNMESIIRGVGTSLQLSKRGGGVAISLTNLRESGAPIKQVANQSSGVIPVMKLLEDSFSYANQLGQRQGAGAVYLNIHHPDIMTFLDSKRENADEKIRIKSLSLGVVVPDVTFELAKKNEDMALFSPYDVEKVYGKPMSDISITDEYQNLLKNPKIKKTMISARKVFQTIAEVQFESGYPYLLFDDTVNRRNPNQGRIVMSNLCTEIAQVNTPSTYNSDLSYAQKGNDVSCNLGSLNIAETMYGAENIETTVEYSIRSLDTVSHLADISSAPSIEEGNNQNHALGLGAMNLHGFLATNQIYYASEEAVDFTNMFFYTVAYYAFKASNKLAIERKKTYANFKTSKYADGSYFEKYTKADENYWTPKTDKIIQLFKKYKMTIPTKKDWINLVESIKKHGLANAHLMAVAPTGSISYLSSCTPSLQPVVDLIETRKEGKLGRVYVPPFKYSLENQEYYKTDAYEMGPYPIIDIVAAAQQHVDQAISLTFFMKDSATTRDLNKAQIYAYKKDVSSIYYVRIRQEVIEGSENYDDFQCETCVI